MGRCRRRALIELQTNTQPSSPLLSSITLGPGGMDAVVALGGGDMRRTLNILQASAMAAPVVDAAAAYATTGNPTPADIEDAGKALLNFEGEDAMQGEGERG